MKIKFRTIVLLLTFLTAYSAQAQDTVSPDDFKIIIGEWTGSLTYIDYSSNKPYTMPANLKVEQGKNQNQLLLKYIYPNEPKANSKDKIKFSKSGDLINNKIVKSKQALENGQLQITTEYSGKDNNKTALIRNLFILGENQFIIRKEVKLNDSDGWITRNEYNFKR
ncbi:MAG: hypothetical protein KJO77_05200 [Bacteroidia bacterium]|nr:hypothetical protein [Bacteroidia bacterium]